MAEIKEETYIVKLSCVNCYTKFEKQFPKGHQAEERGFGDYHFIREPDNQHDNAKCPNFGIFIFKWNEASIDRAAVLESIKWKPLFGHPVLSKIGTHWFTFMKIP